MKHIREASFASIYANVERACAGDRASAKEALALLWAIKVTQRPSAGSAIRPRDLEIRDLATGEAVLIGVPKELVLE